MNFILDFLIKDFSSTKLFKKNRKVKWIESKRKNFIKAIWWQLLLRKLKFILIICFFNIRSMKTVFRYFRNWSISNMKKTLSYGIHIKLNAFLPQFLLNISHILQLTLINVLLAQASWVTRAKTEFGKRRRTFDFCFLLNLFYHCIHTISLS